MSRGPGRVERAFKELLYSSPAANTHPDGLGPIGITVAAAAAVIFGVTRPTISQKSSVHRARLHMVERGEAIDIIYGGDVLLSGRSYERLIGRPRTPEEQAAYDAHAKEVHERADLARKRMVGGE